MKLLFDHNLSPKLVNRLGDLFPNSNHVYYLNLDQVEDRLVWQYARENNFTIVTRDSDYNELLILLGFPPKVIWVRHGNCSTDKIENILRTHYIDIEELAKIESLGLLTLY